MAVGFDIVTARREFPVVQRMLYLDSAHQTPLASSVRAALDRFYDEGEQFGGPKPIWLDRVEEVRARVARLIGADASEIAFTKNTSEGLNIAAQAIPFRPGDNVLMVEGDHPNNAYAFLNLRRKGVEVRFVPLRGETATADTFADHIDPRTRAISLSHVTFHAGHRFDIEGIGALARDKGLYFVIDAMQSAGVVPIDVTANGASLIAFGCHKGLYVPQGLGVLYVRKGLTELTPAYMAVAGLARPPQDLIARADNMELRADAGRFEVGNFNIPDIHALAASLTLIERIGVAAINTHLLDLGDHLIRRLDALGIRLVGPRAHEHRSHIYVLDLPGDGWTDYLASQNVRISPERDGIRVSFGLFNTAEEIDRLIEIIRARNARPARAGAA
jgi:cysteine desulfurase / selenocysteine lyase